MIVAVFGAPGTGKTTLCNTLQKELGFPIITGSVLAARYDPDWVPGQLANADIMRMAIRASIGPDDHVILDGIPRTADQCEVLPENTIPIMLSCDRTIAMERALRRGRPEDTPEVFNERWTREVSLLDFGWTWAGWHRSINTTRKSRAKIAGDVLRYLAGEKRECF